MDFLKVADGSWLSGDGRIEIYFALEGGKATWGVWDADKGHRVDDALDEDGGHAFKTRAKATEWVLGVYLPSVSA
jgi:hypothetical protein